MAKIGLFYGSDNGDTENIAKKVAETLEDVDIFDVAKAKKEDLNAYTNLILATPTYGDGDLQDDWSDFLDTLSAEDFSNKTIAFIGLGDQDTYSETFCDGVFTIYEKAKDAKIIGQTSLEGYSHEDSKAIIDGKFLGLMLDEVNQDDLTDARIKDWCDTIRDSF